MPFEVITREWRFRIALFVLGSLSIGSLLLYFFGVASFARLAIALLTVEGLGLLIAVLWVRSFGREPERRILWSGLWAGCLATVAYDLVRVPIVHAGIPVFKAISYFGTVLLGVDNPTVASEILGWGYHLSNGVSFGLMYAALARRPRPVGAVLWGLSLEAAMLLTPYAEIFGYQRDFRFMSITIGAHAAYGFTLWAALHWYGRAKALHLRPLALGLGFLCTPLSLSAMAADFHGLYAAKIPHSPPPLLGSDLYTVWNVPEPDRVAAIWVWKRFVKPEATFYFIDPFEKVRYGQAFDVPEATVRRSGTESATETLLKNSRLASNPKLARLAGMTHLTEITPWMISSNVDASLLADHLHEVTASECGQTLDNACLPGLLSDLDHWYQSEPSK